MTAAAILVVVTVGALVLLALPLLLGLLFACLELGLRLLPLLVVLWLFLRFCA